MTAVVAPSADMYAAHLAGQSVQGEGVAWHDVRLADWFLDRLPGDEGLLERCWGATLDVGCGPGRLTAALLARGIPSLGIDVSPVAVEIARSRGASAICRDIHERVPGEGRWRHVLLADGNIGIGGDPVRLLRRCASVLHPAGSVLLDLGDGDEVQTERVRWVAGDRRGPWFPWSRVGAGAIAAVAEQAGFQVRDRWSAAGRAQAELGREG